MVTILERKTRFYLAKKVPSKSADDVTRVTIELLKPYKKHVHTITADNGREFADHGAIAKELEADVYFAHPYSFWDRGANENANGLFKAICEERNRPHDADGQRYRVRFIADKLSTKKVLRLQVASHCI